VQAGSRFFAARRAPQAGKTTAEVATIEILFNNVPDDGAPEAVLLFVAVVPDALELVEVVLDQVIEHRGLGISRPVDSLRIAFHMESNCPSRYCANAMFGSGG
jgi:hypothetical protein